MLIVERVSCHSTCDESSERPEHTATEFVPDKRAASTSDQRRPEASIAIGRAARSALVVVSAMLTVLALLVVLVAVTLVGVGRCAVALLRRLVGRLVVAVVRRYRSGRVVMLDVA